MIHSKIKWQLVWLSALLICSVLLSGSRMEEKESPGWTSLFNGKDIKDWIVKIHHHEPGVNFGNTFRVENGIIRIVYDQYGDFNSQFGHLFYKRPFSWFHLKFEYRFVGQLQRGAPDYTLRNSGVMFH